MRYQLLDRVKNCNGCAACVVGCKDHCVKMYERDSEEAIQTIENGSKYNSKEGTKKIPVINHDGCSKCNACVLFCPLFMNVDMPVFDEWYEYNEELAKRDMPPVYRQTMRDARAGKHTEFIGTLCQIAALISLEANKVRPNLILKPMICTQEMREKEEACRNCIFY